MRAFFYFLWKAFSFTAMIQTWSVMKSNSKEIFWCHRKSRLVKNNYQFWHFCEAHLFFPLNIQLPWNFFVFLVEFSTPQAPQRKPPSPTSVSTHSRAPTSIVSKKDKQTAPRVTLRDCVGEYSCRKGRVWTLEKSVTLETLEHQKPVSGIANQNAVQINQIFTQI